MTACVNKKHTRRVALAISASLVGALSLGAAAPAFAQNDIATLSVDSESAFEDAEITSVVNVAGEQLDPEELVFVAGTRDYPTVKQISVDNGTAEGDVLDVTDDSMFEVTYKGPAGAAFNPATEQNWTVGEYTIEIKAIDGAYNGYTKTVTFSVVSASLEDAVIFDNSNKVVDTTDDEFVFNYGTAKDDPNAQKIGVALDGVVLGSDKVQVVVYERGADAGDGKVVPWAAGEYTAAISGVAGSGFSTDPVYIDFTIEKLDLADAGIQLALANETGVDVWTEPSKPTKAIVNGKAMTSGSWVNISQKTSVAFDEPGEYTFTVVVNADNPDAAANMTGYQDVTIAKVEKKVVSSNFTYRGNAWPTSAINVDLSDDASLPFNADKIVVNYNGEKTFEGDELNIWAENALTGEEVSLESVQEPGSWVVCVQVDAEACKYVYGSDIMRIEVNVTRGHVGTADEVYFTYDGSVVNELDKTYTGSDYLDRIGVVVKDGDEVLDEGSDYHVVITDGDGNEVDEIVNAGTYKVTVTDGDYTIDNTDANNKNVLEVEVDAVKVTGISADYSTMLHFKDSAKDFIPYTGSEIAAPAVTHDDVDEDGKLTGERATLPADVYQIDYAFGGKRVTTMLDKGEYTPTVAHILTDGNYTFADTALDAVTVDDAKIFQDVEFTYWGAQAIISAKDLGLMSGYNDGSIFGPEDQTTRAQMAIVLYRLAGEPYSSDDEGHYSETGGWDTGFSDVDGNMYYSEAIAWAHSAGIVGGYGETGEFGPDDPITREQFAIMLANYAKVCNEYIAPADADATLSAYSDGASVADWSRESVAWAVESGLMGQGVDSIWASDPISRAQVATMSVRYVDTFGAESIF